MSDVKIQRMVDQLWDLEGQYSPVTVGLSRQLVLDVYRHGEIQMYQRMWLDHGDLSRMWLDGKGADSVWWQRMVGLMVTRVEPSPDCSISLLDIDSLPLVDEVSSLGYCFGFNMHDG